MIELFIISLLFCGLLYLHIWIFGQYIKFQHQIYIIVILMCLEFVYKNGNTISLCI